jgi:hypothetical protein
LGAGEVDRAQFLEAVGAVFRNANADEVGRLIGTDGAELFVDKCTRKKNNVVEALMGVATELTKLIVQAAFSVGLEHYVQLVVPCGTRRREAVLRTPDTVTCQ